MVDCRILLAATRGRETPFCKVQLDATFEEEFVPALVICLANTHEFIPLVLLALALALTLVRTSATLMLIITY